MRTIHLIAVIFGSMLMKLHGIAVLSLAHKISAALFLILLQVLYIPRNRE